MQVATLINDQLFPEDALKVERGETGFYLNAYTPTTGAKTMIALDVEGAEALAQEPIGFLRSHAGR